MVSYKENICANMVQNDPTERPVFVLDQVLEILSVQRRFISSIWVPWELTQDVIDGGLLVQYYLH